jgi:hypothetical protein
MQSVIVDAVRATMEFPYGADPAASIRRQAIILFWNIAIRRLRGLAMLQGDKFCHYQSR